MSVRFSSFKDDKKKMEKGKVL